MIVKCKECGKEYEVKWTTQLKDYQCECGGDLRTLSLKEIGAKNQSKKGDKSPKQQIATETSQSSPRGSSKQSSVNWLNKQSGGAKVAIGIGVCCIGLFFIIFIGGLFSGEVADSSLTPAQIKQNAQAIDPAILTDSQWYSLRGKPVKFRGVAYGSYSNGMMQANTNNNGKFERLVIYGNVEGGTAINPTDIVDVYGIYAGETPFEYTHDGTPLNAALIKQAIIVPTGLKYQMF